MKFLLCLLLISSLYSSDSKLKISENFAENKKLLKKFKDEQKTYAKKIRKKEKEEQKLKEALAKQNRKGGSLKALNRSTSVLPPFSKES